MVRSPRRDLVDATEVGVYHCVQPAVRRAWLCGQGPVTAKNFDHRKVWIQERLAFLAGQSAIDVCLIAMMSNHVHLVLRNRPDSRASGATRFLRNRRRSCGGGCCRLRLGSRPC